MTYSVEFWRDAARKEDETSEVRGLAPPARQPRRLLHCGLAPLVLARGPGHAPRVPVRRLELLRPLVGELLVGLAAAP